MRTIRSGFLLVAVIMAVVVAVFGAGCGGRRGDTSDDNAAGDDSAARASGESSMPAGKMVVIQSGGDSIQAYLAAPAQAAKGRPAIVVVQEWWGLDDWVKSAADRFAARGYVAIAPDLYRGQVAKDPEHAHELMRGLPEERAVRDIRAA